MHHTLQESDISNDIQDKKENGIKNCMNRVVQKKKGRRDDEHGTEKKRR
jgi:hypothetical protein